MLAAKVRDPAVHVTRPHGLTLEEVAYPADALLAARAEEAARMDAIMHDKPAPGANLTSIRKHSEGGDGEADAGQSEGGKRRDGKKGLQQPEDGARRPARKPKPKKLVKA